MTYHQYAPPSVLKPYVRYFWSYDSHQSEEKHLQIKSFADRYPRFIFQDLEHFVPIHKQDGEKMPACYISGIYTKDSVSIIGGTFSHFGISFHPHALHVFFGVEAHELVNTVPEIQLFCRSDIQSKLALAKSHHERVIISSKYLADKISTFNRIDPLVTQIIHSQAIDESANVWGVAHNLKISERSLERKFKIAIGVTPKKLQRIARFEKALQLLTQTRYSQLTELAHHLNYSDQSHFINDFRQFSGITPYEFVKNKRLGSDSSSFICPT
ncbi:MAG: helix-turn-helix transcriptional regulator [Cyclobacteriaceae bacterium]|nr:helix-turn-helix transcriptional regulator [Cyclobacteriaceae bacterium]